MFSMKRNQIIVMALVVMIAVAGYLNVMDSKKTAAVDKEVVSYQELPDGTLIADDQLLEVNAPSVDEEIGIAMAEGEAAAEPLEAVDAAEADKALELGEDMANTEEEADEPGQAIFVNSSATAPFEKEFFVSAKLEREQTRAKEKDILTEMIGNENLGKDDISQCASALLDIQKRIEKETAAEAMIEAKGFKESYVRIDDDTVDVVVSKEALTEAEIAQIEDIVTRKTGFAADKVKISTLKPAS